MNERIDYLLSVMNENGLDAIIITDEKNMHYYSGFYKGEGYLAIRRDCLIVATDSRYTEYASKVCKGFEVRDIRTSSYRDFVPEGARCGFEDKSISYDGYLALSKEISNLIPLGNALKKRREIKDEYEISCIRKAVHIADRSFEHICSFIKEGVTEKEISAELDYCMRIYGADGNSFPTIAAAGERASLPHAIPTDEKLREGDFLVLDFGCTVDGYCSDMTRTVAIGKISPEREKIYNTVLEAQLKAESAIKAGVSGCDIDNIARDYLDSRYKGCFAHSLGHSVGLDIHENPNFSPRDNSIICEGMVMSVEPGIYIPSDTGVRIEDLVLITADGCEILTKSPKNLLILK